MEITEHRAMLERDAYTALTHIYDTALHLGRWRRALDAVADVADARAIALRLRRSDPEDADLTLMNTTYLKFSRSFWGVYYGVRLSGLQEPDWAFLDRQAPQVLVRDTQMGIDAGSLDARADYALLRRRLDVRRRVGVRLNADKVWFDAMSVAFPNGRDDVPEDAMRVLTPLLPHLSKAAEIGRTFRQLKQRYKALLGALDHVHVGLALALPSGEVIVSNAEAQRIFDLRDGVAKGPDGRLICTDGDQTAALGARVSEAAQTAKGEADQAEMLMALPRRSGGAPFLLDIAPLRDSVAELDRNLQGALITLIDPDRVPYLRLERFVKLYGLTPAEAEVCQLIVEGCQVDEIGERRNTSSVTAKNQINAVLAKTGVSKRTDLIRLVIRVLPP
ncbi:MAG: LuxR C-terminal-related transcriptional regulator, partial [Pseudomonadota bacterium]